MLRFRCENVPSAVIAAIVASLEEFGAVVDSTRYDDGVTVGRVRSVAGAMTFKHERTTLLIDIVEDPGHFSRLMLIGGVKQMVEESAARFHVQPDFHVEDFPAAVAAGR